MAFSGSFTRPNNSGVLFKNDKRIDGSKQPMYTGTALIDGKEKRLAAWIGKTQGGIPKLDIKFTDPQPTAQPVDASRPADQCATPTSEPRAGSPLPEITDFDEIPF